MGASGPLIVAKVLQPSLAYDAERDFEPVSLYGRLPNIIVVSSEAARSSRSDELVDYLKRKPGRRAMARSATAARSISPARSSSSCRA